MTRIRPAGARNGRRAQVLCRNRLGSAWLRVSAVRSRPGTRSRHSFFLDCRTDPASSLHPCEAAGAMRSSRPDFDGNGFRARTSGAGDRLPILQPLGDQLGALLVVASRSSFAPFACRMMVRRLPTASPKSPASKTTWLRGEACPETVGADVGAPAAVQSSRAKRNAEKSTLRAIPAKARAKSPRD